MRVMGHNVLAVVVAAIVIYAIEFLIFAVMIPGEQYQQMTGTVGHAERMPVGIVMPIFAAIALSMIIKWRGSIGWVEGFKTALVMAVLLGFGTALYGYVYGDHTEQFLVVNLLHFLVCWGAAGAVLGAWK